MKKRNSNVLLRAYWALMPQDERFIDRFCAHSELIVPAAEAFRALISGDGRAEQHAADITRLENEADEVTRDTIRAIHRTFVTPFDRSQILDLITALDDMIDLMKDAGRRMLRYGVGFTPEMEGMADCIVRATRELRDGMRDRYAEPCRSEQWTTHTITGSIVGVGAARRVSAVRWGVARSIVLAWGITLPASALVAALCYDVAAKLSGRG